MFYKKLQNFAYTDFFKEIAKKTIKRLAKAIIARCLL